MRAPRHAWIPFALATLALLAPRRAAAQDAPSPVASPPPAVDTAPMPAPAAPLTTAPAPAHHVHHAHRHDPRAPLSLSLGYPNGGRLQNPARLDEDETIRYMPGRRLHCGTDELVALVRRAARAVYRRHHMRLTVGDLSAAGGGPVGHHASHQSGRDADLAFYVVDRRGEQVALEDFVAFGRDGRPLVDPRRIRFDAPANWALLESLLDDPQVHLEHVFVSRAVRAYVLDYARSVGASPSLLARAEATLHQPSTGSPHTNHFHVRIACPAGDLACVEGVRPRPRPRHRAAPVRTHRHRHDA